MNEINVGALIRLKGARPYLTARQYYDLRGQALAGDPDGAMRELRKLLLLQGTNAIKNKMFNVKHRKIITQHKKERNQ